MVNNIDSAFKGSAGLTKDYYEALVTASMEPYRLAVARAKTRKDSLTVESAVYTDLGSKMKGLGDAVKALQATDTSVFKTKRAISSDLKYASASATTEAVDALYTMHIDTLATQHRTWGDKQVSNFTLNLGGSGNTSEFKIRTGTDNANDISITVAHGDNLEAIRTKINAAVTSAVAANTLTSDHAFTASVVDNRLVLQSNSSGTDFALAMSDVSGSVLTDLNIIASGGDTDANANGIVDGNETAATNAQFTVNGIAVTRSKNLGLTDVIAGVTLDLKVAHGTGNTDSINITVDPDSGAAASSINSFVSKLNDFTKWMAAKSDVKDDGTGNYKRGVLANNFGVKSLRRNLVQTTFSTWSDAPTGSTYTRLDQVGLSLGEGLVASLDSAKLTDALKADFDGVVALFDGVMTKAKALIDPYTEGTETQADRYKTSTDLALKTQGDRIKRLEETRTRREEAVRNQIAMQFASISRYNDQGRYLMSTMYNSYA